MNSLYKNQFLLSNKKAYLSKSDHIQIGELYLSCGPCLNYSFHETSNHKLHLLGSLYDWENPEYTNKEILFELSLAENIEKLLTKTSKYCGEFIIISEIEDKTYLFHDACGQKEVYYDIDFTNFGTQPKLVGKAIKVQDWESASAINFYESKIFRKKHLFIGETTHKKNIKHLLPNHYIDISAKKVLRFYPDSKRKQRHVDEVAIRASKMLEGYLKSISIREKIAVAVTAGYDSRVLFLASKNIENCVYYVFKKPSIAEDDPEIEIPQILTRLYNKSLNIQPLIPYDKSQVDLDFENSINFPIYIANNKKFLGSAVYINGNISEVARNYFGYLKKAKAEDLAYLMGYTNMELPIQVYKDWLLNKSKMEEFGYNYLDFFYWEEKMGIWAAKSKTESFALNRIVCSPCK